MSEEPDDSISHVRVCGGSGGVIPCFYPASQFYTLFSINFDIAWHRKHFWLWMDIKSWHLGHLYFSTCSKIKALIPSPFIFSRFSITLILKFSTYLSSKVFNLLHGYWSQEKQNSILSFFIVLEPKHFFFKHIHSFSPCRHPGQPLFFGVLESKISTTNCTIHATWGQQEPYQTFLSPSITRINHLFVRKNPEKRAF